ncbi:thermonuclease family protein [Granulicoccus sp. GXG6511]|uniref:thermonuclease family protein n=1 Tax=Granulicoccus sp. GXG6511 TaxID=3381351 RepID=UPI003D7E604E
MRPRFALAVGGVSIALVAAGVSAMALARPTVVVDRVVDGDTINVRIGDKTDTVRLLNIDAPETKHPGKEVECLGPEASAFLTNRLPAGTVIKLEYDEERRDKHGRLLAGVFESDSLINAEIAAAGLGAPVVFEPNRRFYPEVRAASEDAQRNQVGAYAPNEECALPVQVAALVAATAAQPAAAQPSTPAEVDAEIAELQEHLDVASVLLTRLNAVDTPEDPSVLAFYSPTHLDRLRSDVRDVDTRVRTQRTALKKHRKDLVEAERLAREEEERRAREEAERRAAEEAAREQAEREAAERAATTRSRATSAPVSGNTRTNAPAPRTQRTAPATQPRRTSAPTTAPRPTSAQTTQSESGSYPGYNGPRCYAPGGKTWRPC